VAGGAQTVGRGTDYSSKVAGTISWAEGSFPSVSGVTSASSSDYSLQLNSNTFTGASLCSGAKTPSNCKAAEQFIYSPNRAFIQYWLLGYVNACPAGWTSSGSDCYINSTDAVSVPVQPATNLANIALTGAASSGGDSVAMSVGGTIYAYYMNSSLVNLNAHWNTAEFNIVGNGGGSQYSFNSGSSIVVQTLTDSVTPTTSAPTCTLAGITAETNNLTLVANSCCPIGGSLPGIQFMQSNASAPTAQTCPIDPVDPNWSSVGHPFDGVVAGADVGGLPLFSCRGYYHNGLHPGTTRADWTYCDIGWGTKEYAVQPYETLVPAWIDATNGSVPSNALPFGTDGSGGPTLYACRGYYGQAMQVGKVRSGLGSCRVPVSGSEIQLAKYQVLTSTLPLRTQIVSGAAPPSGAVVGGYDTDGSPLYVCQAPSSGGALAPGSARPDRTTCAIAWGGWTQYVSSYNVLFPNFKAPPPGTFFQAGYEDTGTPLGVCHASYNGTTQVGKYLTTNGTACNFAYGSVEISLASGFQVLAF